MAHTQLDSVLSEVKRLRPSCAVGRVTSVRSDRMTVAGLAGRAQLGDQVSIDRHDLSEITGEIVAMADGLWAGAWSSYGGLMMGRRRRGLTWLGLAVKDDTRRAISDSRA